jgi:hypothetical protein
MTPEEQNNLVDMVAQAVIDRIEQNQQVNQLADMVVARVLEMQRAEASAAAQIEPAQLASSSEAETPE